MQQIDYVVTFTGKHPCGCRHPIFVKTKAAGVEEAISIAITEIEDISSRDSDIELRTVFPENWPLAMEDENSDGLLKPCPFCGNPYVSLVEVYPELSGEILYVVHCGCCNASQLPDCKENAIYHWNQREEEAE
ncbi:Lar family restriction alleviation protein [Salmonella enterica]|nr:Lar family restriction alleviation protein [Salmonella enterica]MDJ7049157.1 Lar family restriction alleviation protein [Salmonella enterica]MDJ7338338.1 Lar family restriction alleviation protein [Salmonella enterica]